MTPHPKLTRLTPHERTTQALMAVGGIRGLVEAVRTAAHNANSRRAYVGAFDTLADAVAQAEREAYRRGQEDMRGVAAALARELHEHSNYIGDRIEALPILDAPGEPKVPRSPSPGDAYVVGGDVPSEWKRPGPPEAKEAT